MTPTGWVRRRRMYKFGLIHSQLDPVDPSVTRTKLAWQLTVERIAQSPS